MFQCERKETFTAINIAERWKEGCMKNHQREVVTDIWCTKKVSFIYKEYYCI